MDGQLLRTATFSPIRNENLDEANSEIGESREGVSSDDLRDLDADKGDGDSTREYGNTVRENGSTVRENSDTVREDGDVVREDGDVVREDGDAIREDCDAVRESGHTVGENDATNETCHTTNSEIAESVRDDVNVGEVSNQLTVNVCSVDAQEKILLRCGSQAYLFDTQANTSKLIQKDIDDIVFEDQHTFWVLKENSEPSITHKLLKYNC